MKSTDMNELVRAQIRTVVNGVPRPEGKGKVGRKLHDDIAAALKEQTKFRIVKEDTTKFLQAKMPVWRDKQSNEVEPTVNQRKIDIVVYDGEVPVALIEIESDLNDLQQTGISNRSGHYDVFSISRSASGEYFDSYKSLERMAAAAIYHHLYAREGSYPAAEFAIDHLEALRSNSPTDHNPDRIPIFLVSGFCRSTDHKLLEARLKSLDAELICKVAKRHLGGPHSGGP
jgi:hypothetical protein